MHAAQLNADVNICQKGNPPAQPVLRKEGMNKL